MRRIQKIHFVGIGGTGMGGIAEVLLTEGYHISGSDIQPNKMTTRLKDLGAAIYIGHHASQVMGVDVVVVSSAINTNNSEIQAAQTARIPIVRRAEMLAELMRFRYGIAVAGTHGKTTTTSLIASILAEANLDPTFVIGGLLNSVGSNARLGLGKYLIAEADESDASFLCLQPMISIVTNIDTDHMSTYQGSFECLKDAFIEFLHRLPFYGLAILCLDDPVIQSLLGRVARPFITYGFHPEADIVACNFTQKGTKSFFTVRRRGVSTELPVALNLPGQHNVQNALAAIGVVTELGISDEIITKTYNDFSGVDRRFQKLGYYQLKGGEALVIDDYGHHPKEVLMTIRAARQSWPEQRIVMVFQPHRYTRTRDLFEDFSIVLSEVDVLFVLDVYAAGEKPILGADAKSLCRTIRGRGRVEPLYVEDPKQLPVLFDQLLCDGDIVLSQGAGNISALMTSFIKQSRMQAE